MMRWRRGAQADEAPASDPSWAQLIANARQLVIDEDLADPDQPFELTRFLRRVEQARGVAVRLIPVELGVATREVCGIYFRAGDTAVIYYAHAATELYRLHNILHELAHLLLGHARLTGPLARPSTLQSFGSSHGRAEDWLHGQSKAVYRPLDEAQADALGAALLGDVAGSARSWSASAELRRGAARLKGAVF